MTATSETLNHDNAHLKVLGSGLLGLILTIGIARFCYTTLLPAMQLEAGLSDLAGGYLATVNYIGYMCGAVMAATISSLQIKDFLYRAGLIAAIVTTAGMALTDNIWLWAALRFVAGISSATGMLISAGLIMNWLMRHGHRSELGIHYAGAGLGIIVSGIAAEAMFGYLDWREQWLAVGLLGIVVAIPAWRWLPRPDSSHQTTSGQQLQDNPPSRRWFILLSIMYFCAGYGYVIGATFLVAIVEAVPSLQGQGQMVWIAVGLGLVPGAILWDRVARQLGELNALLAAFVLQTIGIILPVMSDNFGLVLFSAFLFGGSFIGIVSLVLAMAGRFYPTKPAKLMGKLTLMYGIAQIGAPAIAGIIADRGGSYADSLYIAAAVSVVGGIMILIMQATKRRERT
ncbi:MAG: YbfB/YjiJ family MFS transporter [Amphritea sp.]|nr:YbfB/YjiJ family MFS transporter [Amphritea sp.]